MAISLRPRTASSPENPRPEGRGLGVRARWFAARPRFGRIGTPWIITRPPRGWRLGWTREAGPVVLVVAVFTVPIFTVRVFPVPTVPIWAVDERTVARSPTGGVGEGLVRLLNLSEQGRGSAGVGMNLGGDPAIGRLELAGGGIKRNVEDLVVGAFSHPTTVPPGCHNVRDFSYRTTLCHVDPGRVHGQPTPGALLIDERWENRIAELIRPPSKLLSGPVDEPAGPAPYDGGHRAFSRAGYTGLRSSSAIGHLSDLDCRRGRLGLR